LGFAKIAATVPLSSCAPDYKDVEPETLALNGNSRKRESVMSSCRASQGGGPEVGEAYFNESILIIFANSQ
jgi:hypothetical protein